LQHLTKRPICHPCRPVTSTNAFGADGGDVVVLRNRDPIRLASLNGAPPVPGRRPIQPDHPQRRRDGNGRTGLAPERRRPGTANYVSPTDTMGGGGAASCTCFRFVRRRRPATASWTRFDLAVFRNDFQFPRSVTRRICGTSTPTAAGPVDQTATGPVSGSRFQRETCSNWFAAIDNRRRAREFSRSAGFFVSRDRARGVVPRWWAALGHGRANPSRPVLALYDGPIRFTRRVPKAAHSVARSNTIRRPAIDGSNQPI